MYHCTGINAILTCSWDYRKFAPQNHLFHFDGFNQIKSFIIGSSILHRVVKQAMLAQGKFYSGECRPYGGLIVQILIVASRAYANGEQGCS